MKVYSDLKDMLCDELDGIAKSRELTPNTLEVLDTVVDIVKDLDTIMAMEQEYGDGGYSNGRMPIYMYDDGMMGNSYARGRGSNARRDSSGRYMSEGRSYDGYSGDTQEELKRLMSSAKNDREREAIRAALDHIR